MGTGWLTTATHYNTDNIFKYGAADWDKLSTGVKNPMTNNGTICSFEYNGEITGCSNFLFFDYTGIDLNPVILLNQDTWLSDGEMKFGSAVPIPTAIWLLGSGLIGMFGVRRKLGKS